MNAIGLVLLLAAAGSVILLLRQWTRRRRLRVIHHRVRCPIDGTVAEVAVTTDPAAPSRHQYVEVAGCSLQPRVPAVLPERAAYLWDPPCKVRLEPARTVVADGHGTACRQACVFALNATTTSAAPGELACSSGASDAIALASQAVGNPRIVRLLWYASA